MSGPSSMNASAVKRIMSEWKEFEGETHAEFYASPTEDNLFEWHFTLRGPADTEFEQGIYHGRITLPTEYPFRPPHVLFLTPNGRWEVNKRICLTFTGYHEDEWQPAWGIRTALLGVQALMSSKPDEAGYGALKLPPEDREALALSSGKWTCSVCGCMNRDLLAPRTAAGASTQDIPKGNEAAAAAPVKEKTDAATDGVATQEPPVAEAVDGEKQDAATAVAREDEKQEAVVLAESSAAQNTQEAPRVAPTPSVDPPPPLSVNTAAAPMMGGGLHPRISVAGIHAAEAQACRRTLSLIDGTMGLISALLVLLFLRNLAAL